MVVCREYEPKLKITYIIINDNSIPEQSFYWNMYSTNKYEEHIHKINSMFLDLVTIPEIAKLL